VRIPPALERVIAALSRLPGVGEKTAARFAFHILRDSESYAADLSDAIGALHTTVQHCRQCHHLAEQELCRICTDPGRDKTRVCVTEGIQELIAIHRTGAYEGLYHVLHGVLSPIRGIGPSALTIDSLLARVDAGEIEEVIVATNVDVEGEATALYLQRLLSGKSGLTVSRIATGVPMGGELEYLDQVTLAHALRDRRAL
jgi:recombination protein RecR